MLEEEQKNDAQKVEEGVAAVPTLLGGAGADEKKLASEVRQGAVAKDGCSKGRL